MYICQEKILEESVTDLVSTMIKVSDVLKAITDYKPIFGHRTTIKNQTIWMAFMK